MDKLRVLWLDNQECVLFNSFDKRVSNICPSFVGKVAEKIGLNQNINYILHEENIEKTYWNRTKEIINKISGTPVILKPIIGQYDKIFGKVLVLCPTSNCNLKCIYCSGSAGEEPKRMMSWTLAKNSIDWFFNNCVESDVYTLQFHGAGEPLLNFEVVKKSVEYARNIVKLRGKQLFVRVSTNGMISQEKAKWVAENMQHVSLSIDGTPDIHNFHRPKTNGQGSYKTLLSSIKEFKKTNVLKRINTVITNYNLDQLEDIIKHICNVTNAKELRLLPVSICGRCEQNSISGVNIEKFNKMMDKIIPVAKLLDIKLLSLTEQIDYYTEYYCGACGFNMCVSPEGNISTCIEVLEKNTPGSEEMIVGKYNSHTNEIDIDWKKVAYLRTRTYQNIEHCKYCSFRTNCSGSCLVRAARKNGTVMSVDKEQCEMVKALLSKYFTEIANNPVLDNQKEAEISNNFKRLSFEEAINISQKVIHRFDEVNERKWTIEVDMIELMKQMGDLSKHLLTYEGYYFKSRKNHPNYKTSKNNIANELADILLGLVRIADYYNIDLANAHITARNNELEYIESSINNNT